MNKILFKLIEGKGKFFLMRGYIDPSQFLHYSREGYYEYNRAMKPVIDEALKNGEIFNPEVLNIDQEEMQQSGHSLTDGDTFDIPDGMTFETVYSWDFNCGGSKNSIRLLPEKPEQKEESQEKLWDEMLHQMYQSIQYDPTQHFTIKRKES